MLTMTTYGSWLRGDQRGWVDDGVIFPADPSLEAADRGRLKHPPYRFSPLQLFNVGGMIGRALIERLNVTVLALTVQSWHVHLVIGDTTHSVGAVVKCAKDAVRWGLKPGRPMWTEGFDKRFCFEAASLHRRVQYVEKHNVHVGLPARPWDFITDVEDFLRI